MRPLLSLRAARAATLLCLLAASASAQVVFESGVGTALTPFGDNDEVVVRNVALGFPFTFPGGLTASAVDVTVNGRIFPAGTGGASLFFSDVGSFIAGPPTLAPYFRDQQFNAASTDGLYVDVLADRTVFTWRSVAEFASTDPYSYQCKLFADGRVQFVYDGRILTTLGSAVVGVTEGGGGQAPGASDFVSSPIAVAGSTIYEEFTAIAPAVPFDLAATGIEFVPNGSGGFNVTRTPPPTAAVSRLGSSCGYGVVFLPDGFGGYLALEDTSALDAVSGTVLPALADDSVSAPLPLGFPFAFPDGTVTDEVVVTDNGRVLLEGTESSFGLPPTPFFLQAQPFPVIAPFWARLDPTAAGSEVRFATSATTATITWKDLAQSGEDARVTFQVTLAADGSIVFRYGSTEQFVSGGAGTVMVGLSAGSVLGAGPNEVDIRALPLLGGGSTIYEFFDTTFSGAEALTLQPGLVARSLPQLSTSYDLQMTGLSSTVSAAFMLIGFQDPALDLGVVPALGLPNCELRTSAEFAFPIGLQGDGTSSVVAVAISSDTALIGVPLYAQGLAVGPSGGPTAGLQLTNGVFGTVGL